MRCCWPSACRQNSSAQRRRFSLQSSSIEMGRLSTGAAAQLAGVPKPLFLMKLADYGVDTFDLPDEELRRDMTDARRHL